MMNKSLSNLKWDDKMRRMIKSVQDSYMYVAVPDVPELSKECIHLGGERVTIGERQGRSKILIPVPSRGLRDNCALIRLIKEYSNRGVLKRVDITCSTDKTNPSELTQLGTITPNIVSNNCSKPRDCVIKTYSGRCPEYDLVYRAANLADSHK
jgi:hypothetical protein